MLQKYTGSYKEKQRQRRHQRVRAKISGTADRPRVAVFRSSERLYVQAIDDTARSTLIGMSDNAIKLSPKTAKAHRLGNEFGKRLQEKQITRIVFDRGGYAYHGRVKALADGMREAGLQF